MRSKLRHPIRAIREPFGTAGLIVACLALVLAMGGAAVAAKGGLTGKQKKEVEKIAKKYAGKPGKKGKNGAAGATGPAGPTGPAGANGKDGAPGLAGEAGEKGEKGERGQTGSTGAAGADGKTVLNGGGAPSSSLGEEGDFYIDTTANEIYGPKTGAGWGTGTSLKGPQGDQGPAGPEGVCSTAGCTIPPGVVLRGTWAANFQAVAANEPIFVPISFGVPAPKGGSITYVKEGEEHDKGVTPTCKGGAANPVIEPSASAASGTVFVCVFASNETNWTPTFLVQSLMSNKLPAGAGQASGEVFEAKAAAPGRASAYGVWAATVKP